MSQKNAILKHPMILRKICIKFYQNDIYLGCLSYSAIVPISRLNNTRKIINNNVNTQLDKY